MLNFQRIKRVPKGIKEVNVGYLWKETVEPSDLHQLSSFPGGRPQTSLLSEADMIWTVPNNNIYIPYSVEAQVYQ